MPDCIPFSRDGCHREGCLYRHVRVIGTAPICEGFTQGFCKEGLSCTLRHEYCQNKRKAHATPLSSSSSYKKGKMNIITAGALTTEKEMENDSTKVVNVSKDIMCTSDETSSVVQSSSSSRSSPASSPIDTSSFSTTDTTPRVFSIRPSFLLNRK